MNDSNKTQSCGEDKKPSPSSRANAGGIRTKSSARRNQIDTALERMEDAVHDEEIQLAAKRESERRERHAFLEVASAGFVASINTLSKLIHSHMHAQGFWESDNSGEKIALMHSELSEALEADRKNILQDDHIPEFTGVEAELADTIIRILDFAGRYDLRLAEAVIAKSQYNLNRAYKHGKAY